MKRVLITSGTGNISLVRTRKLKLGFEVVVLDTFYTDVGIGVLVDHSPDDPIYHNLQRMKAAGSAA